MRTPSASTTPCPWAHSNNLRASRLGTLKALRLSICRVLYRTRTLKALRKLKAFDGKVTSRTVLFADGSRKTLGFMLPGDYEFSTGAREVMELLNGEMQVLLPGATQWQTFHAGETFTVPANASFKLKLTGAVDYCCSCG